MAKTPGKSIFRAAAVAQRIEHRFPSSILVTPTGGKRQKYYEP